VVAKFPWFDKMGYCEDGAEEDAETTDDDVSDAEEGVLAAHDGAIGYDYGFCAAVFYDGEVVVDEKLVGSFLHWCSVVSLG